MRRDGEWGEHNLLPTSPFIGISLLVANLFFLESHPTWPYVQPGSMLWGLRATGKPAAGSVEVPFLLNDSLPAVIYFSGPQTVATCILSKIFSHVGQGEKRMSTITPRYQN